MESKVIYNEKTLDYQINDKVTVKQSITFDTIIRRSSGRGHPTQQPPVSDSNLVQL